MMLKDTKKICPHFHFSLQSASDTTLKNMGRRYSVKDFEEAVIRLRETFGSPAICADVIAGFVGESEEDFIESYERIKKAELFELHVFPYSKRRGTKAYAMEESITKDIKNKRAARLLALSTESSAGFINSRMGKELEVLFEEETEICGVKYWVGHSSEYIKCACLSEENIRGQILKVEAKSVMDNGLVLVS